MITRTITASIKSHLGDCITIKDQVDQEGQIRHREIILQTMTLVEAPSELTLVEG